MKKLLPIVLVLLCVSCARFSTKQTDMSFTSEGLPKREITTHATAYTFISSSSELSKFKAMQTDKSQSALVGNLTQSSQEPTNTLATLDHIIGTVVRAAVLAK